MHHHQMIAQRGRIAAAHGIGLALARGAQTVKQIRDRGFVVPAARGQSVEFRL